MPVNNDLPCIECKYNLRGLDERGKCPECGISIAATLARSVVPSPSKYRWTKRVSIAFGLIHALIAILLILSVVSTNSGDGGFMLMVLNLPLWFVWSPEILTNSSFIGYLIFCGIAGSFMYALVGALLGLLIDWLLQH